MQKGSEFMFYLSPAIAIIGAVGYQYFVKRVPASLNPVVSVIGIYVSVLVLGAIMLLFLPAQGGLLAQVRQLSWVQLVIGVCVFMVEIGFLLMYRQGWALSTGNVVTGAVINVLLLGLGLILLGEKVSAMNILGIGFSILGVTLISFRP